MPANKLQSSLRSNPITSATAAGSYQLSFAPYDLSRDDEEYLIPNNVAEMTPGQIDHTAHVLTAARLYLNSLADAVKNWGQINPHLE
jgi:hypothetical protein